MYNNNQNAYLQCLYLDYIWLPLLACCFDEVTQTFLLTGDPGKRNYLATRWICKAGIEE